MKRVLVGWGVVVFAAIGLIGGFAAFASNSGAQAHGPSARGRIVDATGVKLGVARLTQDDGVVNVKIDVAGLTPGIHGFHVHTTGECVAPFTTAGGHYNPGAGTHLNHAGDMPVLLVAADGTAQARFVTDRFTVEELLAGDGSALIIHAGPDNYANIPTARYDPDPDTTTLGTGDAGARVACALLTDD